MNAIQPIKTYWRDTWFDSVLESNWAASCTVWGINWYHHPGSLTLSDGRYYEPDFVLLGAGAGQQDILLETKGEGVPGLDKTLLCQQDNPDKIVLVGRSPFSDGGTYPAAVWHRADGTPYEWDVNGAGWTYVSGELASAEQPGLTFFRAVANTRHII